MKSEEEEMMNALRFMLAAAVVGSALVFAGCGKAKTEVSKPTVGHTDSKNEDHSGHNH